MRILFWLYKSKKNTAHESPLWVRITVNGEREQFATGLFIKESIWSSIAQKAEGKNKVMLNLNQQLDIIKQRLNQIYTQLSFTQEVIDAADVRRMYFGESDKNVKLMEVFLIHNDKITELLGIKYTKSTLKIFRCNVKILRGFIKKVYGLNDIPLRKLTRRFIEDYTHYLLTVKKYSNTTTHKNLQRLNKIVNYGINNGWLERNPFKGHHFALEHKEIEYLTEAELKAIETKHLPVKRVANVRDYFIFQCYTGLSYIDLKNLRREQIRPGVDGELWIFGTRTKTGTNFKVPMLPKALAIMKRHKNDTEFVFKVLPNQTCNSYLKEIAALCDINKDLHTHLARKTFCTTVTLLNGVPMETVTALVGHSSIMITERVYAKVLDEKISRDMNALKGRLTLQNT